MKTPRTEEWLKEIKSAIPQKDSTTELTDWWQFDRVVKDVLTKIRQETLDEAVEIVEKQTRFNMESDGACGDPECCGYPAYDMWESDDGEYLKRDDTIKALQNKK